MTKSKGPRSTGSKDQMKDEAGGTVPLSSTSVPSVDSSTSFDGSAYGYLAGTYNDPTADTRTRLAAAKAALKYEKSALRSIDPQARRVKTEAEEARRYELLERIGKTMAAIRAREQACAERERRLEAPRLLPHREEE
jgi:hypothetical protein